MHKCQKILINIVISLDISEEFHLFQYLSVFTTGPQGEKGRDGLPGKNGK